MWWKNVRTKDGFMLVEALVSLFLIASFVSLFVTMIPLQTRHFSRQQAALDQQEALYCEILASIGQEKTSQVDFIQGTAYVPDQKEVEAVTIELESVENLE
ncbi:hypothetical protein [Aerococcus sp. Group 1]|uniref:hypothetical protein n=1 Tax=Aerococcus urinae (strain CCUG 59500 / ACS-120-V-Col10a) TaxID=2976812 RepID=UPI00227A6122|nr:hypothetical protein [Aerococcus sp. Group 1]MCY3030563.1 hypothetical protein [Aerococcus sp. Group 1]